MNGLVGLYTSSVPLDEGSQGGEREVKVGDDLALLAAHALLDLSEEAVSSSASDGKEQLVLTAAAVLEQAYENSPAGFQLGLLLMECYSRLGMADRVCELYTKLDIKHIQIDSLSHLVIGDTMACGKWDAAAQCCDNVDMLWKSCRVDDVESTRKSFQMGNLGHGVEFMRLDQRVSE